MKGTKLKEKRLKLGLTQGQLAELLGVQLNTVSRWEIGALAVPRVVDLAMEALEHRGLPKNLVPGKKIKMVRKPGQKTKG
jgi:transcriptional regulator with XRE-family HTH domain